MNLWKDYKIWKVFGKCNFFKQKVTWKHGNMDFILKVTWKHGNIEFILKDTAMEYSQNVKRYFETIGNLSTEHWIIKELSQSCRCGDDNAVT